MPDGTLRRSDIEAACAMMNVRLIAWGLIILVGGNGARQKWDSDDETHDRQDFSGAEQDAAYALHLLVSELPEVRQRFVMQAFYKSTNAAQWEALSRARRVSLSDDLADQVNDELRRHNRTATVPVRMIGGGDIDGIRERAIRMLVNREVMTQ